MVRYPLLFPRRLSRDYSGHGTQMDENVGLTAALDPERDEVDEALYIWGDDGAGTVLLDDGLGFLGDRLNTDRVLFVLDACYSGTGSRGATGWQAKEVKWDAIQSAVKLPGQYLVSSPGAAVPQPSDDGISEVLNQPQRHVLLAASADDQVSWTAEGWPNRGGVASVFTYYLAERLESAPPTATFQSVMAQVRDESLEYSRRTYNSPQTPQAEGTQTAMSIREFLRATR